MPDQDPVNYLLRQMQNQMGIQDVQPRQSMGPMDAIRRFLFERKKNITLQPESGQTDPTLAERDPRQVINRILGGN